MVGEEREKEKERKKELTNYVFTWSMLFHSFLDHGAVWSDLFQVFHNVNINWCWCLVNEVVVTRSEIDKCSCYCCSFLQFVNNVRQAGPIFFYTVPIITENITLISYLNASTARLLSGEIYLAVAWSEATPCSALTHEPVLSKGITSRKS